MPIYEYVCAHGHLTTLQDDFSAKSQITCTSAECNLDAIRQISTPAIIFKGSGFYSTDNRTVPDDHVAD